MTRHDALCLYAANLLGVSWNDFEVEYLGPNSIMVRLDSNGQSYLIERHQYE